MSGIKERYSVERITAGQHPAEWAVWYTPTWTLVGTYKMLEKAWRAAECDDADRMSMAAEQCAEEER